MLFRSENWDFLDNELLLIVANTYNVKTVDLLYAFIRNYE